MNPTIQISSEVKAVFEKATITDTSLILNGILDRDTYVKVNKVLEAAGGKWDKKSKSHIFKKNPKEVLGFALDEGKIIDKKKSLQAFYTPDDLAKKVVQEAGIKQGMKVLEPSAGAGSIALAAKEAGAEVFCFDIDKESFEILASLGFKNVCQCDFLRHDPKETAPFLKAFDPIEYDAVVMNPPFTKDQDIEHVLHAFSMLKKDGILVAIMSPGFTFGVTKKRKAFREFVEKNGEWTKLPEKSFSDCGTNVNTVLVKLIKS